MPRKGSKVFWYYWNISGAVDERCFAVLKLKVSNLTECSVGCLVAVMLHIVGLCMQFRCSCVGILSLSILTTRKVRVLLSLHRYQKVPFKKKVHLLSHMLFVVLLQMLERLTYMEMLLLIQKIPCPVLQLISYWSWPLPTVLWYYC